MAVCPQLKAHSEPVNAYFPVPGSKCVTWRKQFDLLKEKWVFVPLRTQVVYSPCTSKKWELKELSQSVLSPIQKGIPFAVRKMLADRLEKFKMIMSTEDIVVENMNDVFSLYWNTCRNLGLQEKLIRCDVWDLYTQMPKGRRPQSLDAAQPRDRKSPCEKGDPDREYYWYTNAAIVEKLGMLEEDAVLLGLEAFDRKQYASEYMRRRRAQAREKQIMEGKTKRQGLQKCAKAAAALRAMGCKLQEIAGKLKISLATVKRYLAMSPT